MAVRKERLGILVGGGPSPGINSAISAVVIKAINSGLEVVGLRDGFQHLMDGPPRVESLTIADVSRVHTTGGSILGTSRANPAGDPAIRSRTAEAIKNLAIDHLVTIGGDDTAFSAYEVARAGGGAFRVAHIPKTIDNDILLPGNAPTFGFETARHVGTGLVLNLMEDSRATNRWYFVEAMGRKAGHLALGVGKAAGATLTVLAEEFPQEQLTLDEVCAVLEGAILKRRVMGHEDGLAVIAEGVAEKISVEELAKVPGVVIGHDPHGHIRLSEVPLATILRRRVEERFAERGQNLNIVDVTIGYELRSAAPIPFDIDYTRNLGYGAVRFLLSPRDDERIQFGGIVSTDGGSLRTVPFEDMRDPETGRTRVRLVDVNSLHYRVACEYMIRLEQEDLEDSRFLRQLADVAGMTTEEFLKQYAAAARVAPATS
jgi:6-phosphofructokinase 1